MTHEIAIRKLIDYLLLNAYSVNSTGLYSGKVGLSLCLFEVSKLLQDEYIEEQAFELLQESLLSINTDISFENGLSGIGYVLLYLIENKFIEADFEESFGGSLKKIVKGLEVIEKQKPQKCISNHFRIVFFLNSLSNHSNNSDDQVKHLINFFSEETARLLEEYISTIEKQRNVHLKMELNAFIETYLKIATLCPHFTPIPNVLNQYAKLYQQNKLVCSFSIGHYLDRITKEWNNQKLEEVAKINKSLAIKNIYPEAMFLSQRINMLCLLRQNQEKYAKEIELLEDGYYHNIRGDALERNLMRDIDPANFVAGYQFGIARFLLYWVLRHSHKPHKINLL